MSAAIAVFLAIVVSALIVVLAFRPFAERVVKILETKTELAKPKEIQGDPMPAQLYQFAMRESEEWARDQTVKAMREMYDECKDWNQVYTRMLIEEARSMQEVGIVN